jgi:ABC-type bacteriocin/lantibiotic exporter with double-glycine peptidase domain
MTDVEGVRNLIGTGVIDFFGGILTAVIAFCVLIRLSIQMTLVTFVILVMFGLVLQRAFKTIRPIFRERAKINAEVTGRLTESLGGVRVVKGYHAEQSEANVFAAGAQRLLQNVISSLTAQSLMALASTAILGIVGALIMYLGAHQVVGGRLTTGGYVTYVMFLAFMIAPIAQLVSIGTQLTEAVAGLDRTSEILNESEEDSEPNRTVTLPTIQGNVAFNNVTFSYTPENPFSTASASNPNPAPSPRSSAPPVPASPPSSRSSAPSTPRPAARFWSTASTSPPSASPAIDGNSASSSRTPSSSTAPSARTSSSAAPMPPKSNSWKHARSRE